MTVVHILEDIIQVSNDIYNHGSALSLMQFEGDLESVYAVLHKIKTKVVKRHDIEVSGVRKTNEE